MNQNGVDVAQGIFVYGTLQRGEVRERMWPRRAVSVEPAEVRGALFDLGPYPALVAGEDRVAGELWRFGPNEIEATLTRLDEVEGCRGSDDDLYRRVVIECATARGSESAWTYYYARPETLAAARRVTPDANGLCCWSNPQAPLDEV